MKRKVLLIVDAQNDFIDGSLAVSGAAEAIYNLASSIAKKECEYDLVIMTMDWHPATHCSFTSNGGQWPVHCVEHTEGANIRQVLLDAINAAGVQSLALHKGTNEDREEYSIFKNQESSERLLEILLEDDVTDIDVCGIALDYCVINTIDDAIKHGLGKKMRLLKDYSPAIGDPDAVYKKLEDEGIPVI